ncbi:MAG: sigma-70 family RNA polymerase sigma factor [Planctomycetes bacterium]|nr:sigma-70 family RNA polymerase sigma factor [Planctomycetota bacterium]
MPTTAMMIEALVQHRAKDPTGCAMPADYFWQLVERFKADLVNQAFAILSNVPDAEDVAQASLCEAFEGLNSLKDPQQLGNWLRQINRRNAVDLLRRRKRDRAKLERAGQDPMRDTSATGGFSRVDLKEIVARAIDALPTELREIVVLRYWEHLSYQDIAARLGLPVGTVKSQLFRSDGLLEQRLRKYVDPAGPSKANSAAKEPETP